MVMSNDIGIDLGTASILVYIKGKGVVLKEPSVVAIDRDSSKIMAIGEEARLMIGRTWLPPLKVDADSNFINETMLYCFTILNIRLLNAPYKGNSTPIFISWLPLQRPSIPSI